MMRGQENNEISKESQLGEANTVTIAPTEPHAGIIDHYISTIIDHYMRG